MKQDIVSLKIWLNYKMKPTAVIECSSAVIKKFKADMADEQVKVIDLDGFMFLKSEFKYATED